jgi:hypothetical protein
MIITLDWACGAAEAEAAGITVRKAAAIPAAARPLRRGRRLREVDVDRVIRRDSLSGNSDVIPV